MFIHFFTAKCGGGGGQPPRPICNEGAPFEEGCEGDFARDFLLRLGEDTFSLLIIVEEMKK